MSSLYEPIKTVLINHFDMPADTIHADSTLEDLGLDSLGLVELMCALQDELGLRVPVDSDFRAQQITFSEAVTRVEQAQEQEVESVPVPRPAASAPVSAAAE